MARGSSRILGVTPSTILATHAGRGDDAMPCRWLAMTRNWRTSTSTNLWQRLPHPHSPGSVSCTRLSRGSPPGSLHRAPGGPFALVLPAGPSPSSTGTMPSTSSIPQHHQRHRHEVEARDVPDSPRCPLSPRVRCRGCVTANGLGQPLRNDRAARPIPRPSCRAASASRTAIMNQSPHMAVFNA